MKNRHQNPPLFSPLVFHRLRLLDQGFVFFRICFVFQALGVFVPLYEPDGIATLWVEELEKVVTMSLTKSIVTEGGGNAWGSVGPKVRGRFAFPCARNFSLVARDQRLMGIFGTKATYHRHQLDYTHLSIFFKLITRKLHLHLHLSIFLN